MLRFVALFIFASTCYLGANILGQNDFLVKILFKDYSIEVSAIFLIISTLFLALILLLFFKFIFCISSIHKIIKNKIKIHGEKKVNNLLLEACAKIIVGDKEAAYNLGDKLLHEDSFNKNYEYVLDVIMSQANKDANVRLLYHKKLLDKKFCINFVAKKMATDMIILEKYEEAEKILKEYNVTL
jgi:hypothetical protein